PTLWTSRDVPAYRGSPNRYLFPLNHRKKVSQLEELELGIKKPLDRWYYLFHPARDEYSERDV
ncbi:MAG: hypothetical protein NUW37_06500, partial [Planctomycetes bacterium]|nr:hypothetical protein [Planctomycetota bacterium]